MKWGRTNLQAYDGTSDDMSGVCHQTRVIGGPTNRIPLLAS